MGIQFIPNQNDPQQAGQGILQAGTTLAGIFQQQKLAKLQQQELGLKIQTEQTRQQSAMLEQQLLKNQVSESTDLNTAIKSSAGALVEGLGLPGEYKALMTGVVGYKIAGDVSKAQQDTQLTRTHNALLQQQLFNAQAQAPFVGPTARAQMEGVQADSEMKQNQLGVALQTRDSTVGLHKASLGEALDKLPKPMRDELMKSMPDLASGVKSGALDYSSINDMVEQLAQTDPSAAMTLKMAGTPGGHYLMQPSAFDEKGNPQPSPFANATGKLNDMWVKRQEALDKVNGKQSSKSMTDSSSKMDTIVKMEQDQRQSGDRVRIYNEQKPWFESVQNRFLQIENSPFVRAPINRYDYALSPPKFMQQGFKDYSKRDVEAIFKTVVQTDATPIQSAKMHFFLEKLMQSNDPQATMDAFNDTLKGDGLSSKQAQSLIQLNKLYKWGLNVGEVPQTTGKK